MGGFVPLAAVGGVLGLAGSNLYFHRFILWPDRNSEFYGSYENTAAQARGEVVREKLE